MYRFRDSFLEAIVCQDLGGDELNILDLAIGSGRKYTQLVTPSELLIDGDYILLGDDAGDHLEVVEGDPRRMIDSIKQFITLKDISYLTQQLLTEEQDPDRKFNKRDILLIYLAHLMTLVEEC